VPDDPRAQWPGYGHRRERLGRAFQSSDSYATTLTVAAAELYDLDFLEWAPETIYLQLQDDLGVTLPAGNLDRIMAAVSVLSTDRFYRDLPGFIQLCNVFAGSDFTPLVFDPADAWEMAWAITEVALLDPPDEQENVFSDDIRRYIGEMVKREGIVNPPDVLALAIFDEHNPDPMADFADDPVLYSAYWKNQASKGDEIKLMLKRQLAELLSQIDELDLRRAPANG